jgi:hypothetical protein
MKSYWTFATFARDQEVAPGDLEECIRFIEARAEADGRLDIGSEYALVERRGRERAARITMEMIRRYGTPAPAADSSGLALAVAEELGMPGDQYSDVVFVRALDAIRARRARSN